MTLLIYNGDVIFIYYQLTCLLSELLDIMEVAYSKSETPSGPNM